jgi:hypothetical protein
MSTRATCRTWSKRLAGATKPPRSCCCHLHPAQAGNISVLVYIFISSLRNSELVMNTFNDTEWDIVVTGAQLGVLNRRCNNLAKQVKKPTRFPIIPLECTLARARAKSEMRRRRSTPGSDEVAGQWHTSESAVVDGRGRTRAAAKKAAAAKNGAGLVSAGLEEIQQKTDTKRKRGQAQNAGQQKASRRRQTR